jgi:hypothetical protein
MMADQRWRACPGRLLVVLDGRVGGQAGQGDACRLLSQGYDKVMTAAFSKATGMPVKLDDNSTGPLLTQIEAPKNNPDWGWLWVDGATAFAGLDQQGLLQKGFEPNVTWDSPAPDRH